MASDDASLQEGSLGYSHSIGGLNHQKLALFGLLLKAFHDGPRRIVLPDFILFDIASYNHTPIRFDQVWRSRPLRDFAARNSIEIVDTSPRGAEDISVGYLHYAMNYIPRSALMNELASDSFTCGFFRSLVPHIQGSDLLHRVTDAAFARHGIHVVAQLRIENDWSYHTEHRVRPFVVDAEDNAPSFKEIIAKICNTLPDSPACIYVVSDEAALSVTKGEIRRAVKQEFNIDLFWKSDFLSEEDFGKLSVLELSMLDFEMAVGAELFVGHTRSSFANGATLEKYARTHQPVKGHYVYNVTGPKLALRRDNGAFWSPALAAAPDPLNADLDFHLAQVFHSAGDRERALKHYVAWVDSGAAKPDESFISLYRAAQIKSDLGHPFAEVIDTYLRATEVRPCRMEALHGASRYCRLTSHYKEGHEIAKGAVAKGASPFGEVSDALFIEPWIYEYGLLDEFAINAYWAGEYQDSLDACERILREGKCPEAERSRIERNASFARQPPPTFITKSDPAQIAELAKKTRSDLATLYFKRSGPKSNKWLHYLDIYDRYLSSFRNRPIRFLEIGIADGGSFAVWRPYLGPNATIYGIDIDEGCRDKVESLGLNCHSRIGSQDDAAFLFRVVEDMGGVDIVIDDGSHIAEHQCATFRTLFPLLENGGLYICEDLHTSYWPDWHGGHRQPGTFIELVKDMIDSIHTWYWPLTNDLTDMQLHKIVSAIHVHDSLVVIEKSPVEPPTMMTS